jgi:DNA-binding transcriptional MerR regulator
MGTKYTIEQLSELTGFPIRTIRFYIQQGMIPASAGRGLGAGYDDSHLEPLLEIHRLQTEGVQLSAIRTRLARPATACQREVTAMSMEEVPVAKAASRPALETCHRFRLADGCEVMVTEAFRRQHPECFAVLSAAIHQLERENRHE